MRKPIKIAAVLLAGCFALYYALSSIGRMNGTVVDAETGKPIEGAIVLVEWTMQHGIGLTYTTSYKVTEKVTDKNGRFTVYDVPNPFVDKPDITIYKKGYVAWSNRSIFPDGRKRTDFIWGNFIFKLGIFKKGYSHAAHTSFIDSSINSSLSDNYSLKEHLMHEIEWEERLAFQERMTKNK